MAETIIYGPQVFTSDFSTASYSGDTFESSSFGGADGTIAGYPEFAFLENVKRVLGTGPSGENVCDVRGAYGSPDDYVFAQLTCMGVGPLTGGQYDCRGPIHARGKFKLSSAHMINVGYSEVIDLFGGGPTGTSDNFTNTTFAGVVMSGAGASANFNWEVRYTRRNGTNSGTNTTFTGPADVADDAWHTVELIVTPAIVTGAFNGSGGVGSATVGTDGAISVLVDDVEIISLTGLANTINFLATTNPEVYYGFGYKHGDWE
jgi:hypothetical protein